MSKKAWIGIAVALGMAMVLALWFAKRPTKLAENGTTIRIGAIDPLTGPFAAYGEPIRDGMLPTADKSNAKRGIEGGKIETTIPNRPHSTTDLSTSQPSPEQPISPPQATSSKSLWVWNAISSVLNPISVLLSIVSVGMALYAIKDSRRLTGALQIQIDQVGKQAALLAKQVPRDLRILVPVDQKSYETGAWGKSLLYGMREYLRQRGNTFFLKDQGYRLIIDEFDDEGQPEKAINFAQTLSLTRQDRPFPLAVIGPISTSCADASIQLYRKAYATKKAVHLLPVPTGTTLLSGSFEDGKTALSPCIFRMPPNNKQQARTILRTIEVLGAKDNWAIFCLTYPDSNTYISDLHAMLEKEARDRWQSDIRSVRLGERRDLLGSSLKNHVETHCQYKTVVVIGAWQTNGEFPCVREFINNWRSTEQTLGMDPAVILLSDYPVPGAVQGYLNGETELLNVYATFQIRPDTLERTLQHVPTSEAIDLSLIAYGYDSLRLIDYLIQKNATLEPDCLVDALRQMPQFDGFAQTYQFSKTTNENVAAKFHVYRFEKESDKSMPHFERCPCQAAVSIV